MLGFNPIENTTFQFFLNKKSASPQKREKALSNHKQTVNYQQSTDN